MHVKKKLKSLLSRRTKASDNESGSADGQLGDNEQDKVDTNAPAHNENDSNSLAGQPGSTISKSAPTNKASDTPIDELWSLAYEHLRESDGDLIAGYEDQLRGNFALGLGSMLASNADVRDKMKTILQRKMDEVNRDTWKVKFRSSEVHVKDLVQPVLGVVNWANEYVSAAVKASPSASIAWAGISLLLPLFLNPSKEAASLAKGLEYVSSLIARSYMWEGLYIRRCQSNSSSNGPKHILGVDPMTYKDALQMLYQHILRFQITGYCYYANNTALRLSQDVIQWNEWDTLLSEIRDQEVNFAAVNATWRDSTYAEECLAAEKRHEEAIFQWQHIGKDVSGLLDAVQDAREEERRSELLQWLCTVDPSASFNAARDKHIEGTSDWLLRESEEYESWEQSPSSLLWLHGKAGCGKSILSSSVIGDIKHRYRSDPQTALAYFFFSFSDSSKQKVDVMLASLVKQLYASRPDTPQPVENLEGYKIRCERPDTKTLESALLATMRGFAATSIVIDALDECPSLDGEREKLMSSLCRIIVAIPNNVHVLCTSRAEADIVAAMSSVLCSTQPSRAEIDLNEQRRRIDSDIGLYIDSTLASSAYSSWPNSLKEEARKSLIENAEGMFQYVSSQFEALRKLSSAKAVREAIQQLPVGLDATYDRILLSLDLTYRTQIASSLQWLASSTRDLTVEELAEVFILRPGSGVPFDEAERLFKPEDCVKYLSNLVVTVTSQSSIPTANWGSAEDWASAAEEEPLPDEEPAADEEPIDDSHPVGEGQASEDGQASEENEPSEDGVPSEKRESSSEEELSQDGNSSSQSCDTYIRLAHFTVKEYLISDRITQGPAAAFSFTETDAHLHVARSSLPYHLHCHNLSEENNADFKLMDYTFENWAFHLEMVPRKLWSPDLVHLTLQGLSVRGMRERLVFLEHRKLIALNAEILDGPHFFTARQGFVQLTDLLLSGVPGTNPYLTQHDLNMMLREAAGAGQIAVVQLLLAKGAEFDAENEIHGGALQAAAYAGHKEVVELLLHSGANIDAPHGEWGSALQAAVAGDQLDAVQLLLERGADVGCALILACGRVTYRRRLECLRILLDSGADINRQCGIHGTALHEVAAKIDSSDQHAQESFHLLLERGADVNLPGGKYGYPLQALCQNQDAPISEIMLLLDRGANVNARGGRHGSALQTVIWFHTSGKQVAKLLLERGADIDMQGGWPGSALHAACRRGIDAVRFLLENGADVNIHSSHFGSAFHEACRWGNLELIRLLLDKGANVNALGGEYGSALQAAAFRVLDDDDEVLKLLLSRGADVHAEGGDYGTALQAACSTGQVEKVRILLDHGADVNIVSGEYGTALQAACHDVGRFYEVDIPRLLIDRGADVHLHGGKFGSAWHAGAAQLDVKVEAVLDLLLDHGVDIDEVKGGQHGTALQATLEVEVDWPSFQYTSLYLFSLSFEKHFLEERVDRVLFLLDHGVNVNIGGGKYAFSLQSACAKEHNSRLTRLLLDSFPGIDVNEAGGVFGSALQAAVHSRQEDSVRLLLDKGADVNARGGRYGSALNAAVFRGFWDIVKVLLDRGAIPDSQQLPEPDEQWLSRIMSTFADEEWIPNDYFTPGNDGDVHPCMRNSLRSI